MALFSLRKIKRIKVRHLGPLIGLALFLLALLILNRALGENSYQDILRYIADFPPARISGAIALTALSYFILTLYDHLALRYLQKNIGKIRVSLASFISYCFSRNLGFALLTGGSIRYRFYSAWGLSAEEIARLITFAATTFLVGFLAIGGSILLVSPATLPETSMTAWVGQPLGVLALLLLGAYLLLVTIRQRPFRLLRWELSLPTPSQSLTQLLVGSIDWVVKAGGLYYLLSGIIPISLIAFLEVYLIAQIVAALSHVPGGLGVFESVVVLLIPDLVASDLLAILLVHRGIYYMLPFASAILLLGGLEGIQQAKTFRRAQTYLGQWLSGLAPPVFAGAILFTGAILLFSCATPTMAERLDWVGSRLPLPLIEFSHFLLALAGSCLLLLARGLQRRLKSAYIATLILLTFAIGLTLLKGITFEQVVILVLILATLIPSQNLFYRDAALRDEPFSLGWVTVILIAFGSALWLLWVSYEHQSTDIGRWIHFALQDDGARSLRAMTGATAVLVIFACLKLCQPKISVPLHPDPPALKAAAQIILHQSRAASNLALLGDKSLLFTDTEDAFLAFSAQGRYWVALGDPIGATQRISDLAWCFNDMCGGHGAVPVFYQVGEDFLSVYLDMGLALVKIGNEAIVPLNIRNIENLDVSEQTKCRFEIEHTLNSAQHTALKRLGTQWSQADEDKCGFSQGCFDLDYMARFARAVLYLHDEPVAFALLLPGGQDKTELSIDLMRFSPQHPNRASLLLHRVAQWGRDQGYRYFNLGVIPNQEDTRLPSPVLWHSLGVSAFRNGGSFPSIKSMQDVFETLQPEKRPRYVAFPGEVSSADVLEAVATLILTSRPPSQQDHADPFSKRMYCETS